MIGAPFFVVGSARSGTTLLRLMLNAHPEVAVPPESRFIVELWTGNDDVDVAEFLPRLASHRQFSAWELPVDAVRAELGTAPRVSYARAVSAPYDAYARSRDRSRWGDKTPRYVEHIPFLSRLFPDARFIHLVRDGRNVALSYADLPFGPRTIGSAARLWARRVRVGIETGRALGPRRYLELHYEDLVDEVDRRAKEVCDFLGLDFDPGMLDYTERSKSSVLPRAEKYNPHVTEEPVRSTRSWEEDMRPDYVEAFEAVAGDVLDLAGYPRRIPRPGLRARTVGALGRDRVPWFGRLNGRGS